MIQLDNTNKEMINVPVLKVSYRARSLSTIQQGGINSLSNVSFETNYQQGTKNFNRRVHRLFWVVLVLTVLSLIVVTYFQFNRPSLESEETKCVSMFIRLIVNTITLFSKFFFWFIFAVTGWVFVFFKLQDRVYTFMPPLSDYTENYKQYDWLFGIVCGTKLVSMMFTIYFDQCSLELFMIDWERPKLIDHDFFDEKEKNTEKKS